MEHTIMSEQPQNVTAEDLDLLCKAAAYFAGNFPDTSAALARVLATVERLRVPNLQIGFLCDTCNGKSADTDDDGEWCICPACKGSPFTPQAAQAAAQQRAADAGGKPTHKQPGSR